MSRRQPRQTTVPSARPPHSARRPSPPKRPDRPHPPKRDVARIIDPADATLLDVVDSLLNRGVVLRADVMLALAGVDLVYVRLSALLCAADRLLPRDER